uniref:Uncharacterized protein n=1 Tax=Zea mays TaxID=4577 RepID=C4J7D9_MAIZE|nr:unknown [Zea mays]
MVNKKMRIHTHTIVLHVQVLTCSARKFPANQNTTSVRGRVP